MTTAKKKSGKRSAKAPARKTSGAKSTTPARKKPAKASKRREETAAAPRPASRAASRSTSRSTSRATRSRKRTRAAAAAAPLVPPSTLDARSRLGAKWVCFKCNAKFYDLNRPEPVCPKCGANQHERPKRDPRPKASPDTPPAAPRSVDRDREMIPVEEEEDDGLLMEDEEIDLGGAGLDGDSDDFGDDEEEEDVAD